MEKTKKNLCLLLATCLLTGLAACGKTAESEENNNDIVVDDSVSGEVLTSGNAADNVFSLAIDLEKSLNPITTRSSLNQMVDNLVYDRLFEVDENFNLSSRILEDWYYTKNDSGGGTWVLTVREGIQMHDGSTLTSQDIYYSISRAFTQQATFYQGQMGRVYVYASGREVYLTGDYANGLLPWRMSVPIIKSVNNSILENVPIGSGPYTYSEDLTCLEKFDDYEYADQLPVDTIYLRPYTGPEGLITEFESALVDVVVNDPTSIYNMGYGGKSEKRVIPTTNLHFIGFNGMSEFFQYESYRYAMNWIIDRERIADQELDGAVTASALPIHPNSSLYDTTLADALAYNPARARQELERAGCRDLDADGMLEYALSGVKMEINVKFLVCADNPAKVQAARRIAEDMEAIGLGVNLQELTWKEYLTALEEGEFDMFYGEIGLAPDWNILTLFVGDRVTDGTLNYGQWSLDTLENAVYTFIGATEEERPDAETAMIQELSQSAVLIPICFENKEVISHLGVITGMKPNQYDPFCDVANWQIHLD